MKNIDWLLILCPWGKVAVLKRELQLMEAQMDLLNLRLSILMNMQPNQRHDEFVIYNN